MACHLSRLLPTLIALSWLAAGRDVSVAGVITTSSGPVLTTDTFSLMEYGEPIDAGELRVGVPFGSGLAEFPLDQFQIDPRGVLPGGQIQLNASLFSPLGDTVSAEEAQFTIGGFADPLGQGISNSIGPHIPTVADLTRPVTSFPTVLAPAQNGSVSAIEPINVTSFIQQSIATGNTSVGFRFDPTSNLTSVSPGPFLTATDDPLQILKQSFQQGVLQYQTELAQSRLTSINIAVNPTSSIGVGVAPDQLAHALGYDHFNWEQTMSGPGNWQWYNYAGPYPLPSGAMVSIIPATNGGAAAVTDSAGTLLGDAFLVGGAQTQHVDLALQRDGHYLVHVLPIDSAHKALGPLWTDIANPEDVFGTNYNYQNPLHDGPAADNVELYYSEQPPNNTLLPQAEYAPLQFADTPEVPDWALSGMPGSGEAAPNFYFSFHTELVGVTANGGIKDLGLGFSWKSNAVFTSDPTKITSGGVNRVSFLGTGSGESEFLPDIANGGVFDVELDQPVLGSSVPEPSTLVISSILFGVFGVAGLRRRLTHSEPSKRDGT